MDFSRTVEGMLRVEREAATASPEGPAPMMRGPGTHVVVGSVCGCCRDPIEVNRGFICLLCFFFFVCGFCSVFSFSFFLLRGLYRERVRVLGTWVFLSPRYEESRVRTERERERGSVRTEAKDLGKIFQNSLSVTMERERERNFKEEE